ncbi:sucrose-6-phosphate hydrolase-like [Maniola hyperantus]|uniref:sucrose-6-phosphate hydrolase-like n=1 Tax=Aphantopus hyperantus TaxID=2795564 RepID=UPI00156979BE|nr:sucrose-6-phosphate hydrolase-like [Maniola hyperantus]
MRVIFNTLTLFFFLYSINGEITNDRYYPMYHAAPPFGWMNDPNGFARFKSEYHLFYQYNPDSSLVPGTAAWGHMKSSDLVHWQHLPIAMYPNNTYDRSGVFSGSALIEDGKMYLYYTAHINHPGETPDHEENQALAISEDGVNVVKYENNPIIPGTGRQPDIRDPKVWKHGDTYYLVLGNKFKRNGTELGRVLLYASKDKYTWEEKAILDESDGWLGYMWECPDFFQLGGYFVLLFSPQGVKPEGDKYRNLYQCGYIVGRFDYKTLKFTPVTEFQELDHGHDFYATQSILDDKKRRLVIAWLDMWETNYPEQNDGFTGQMTLPRILTLTKDLRLLQRPVPEIRAARADVICTGQASGGTSVTLANKAGEVNIRASASNDLELFIEGETASVVIYYDATNGQISLDRGGEDGLRRTEWRPKYLLKITIYIDASSIEVFCGDGQVTFSSRYFTNGPVSVRLGDSSKVEQFRVINMKRTVPIN